MDLSVLDLVGLTRAVIRKHRLADWLEEFPWLTGSIGDPGSPVWFLAENPSLKGVRDVHQRTTDHTPNLQWNCFPGTPSRLLREAITAAGLKTGDLCADSGWRCYVTNVDKEPQEVGVRNRGKKRDFMERQARRWKDVLQAEVDHGSPKVLVCLGGQAEQLLDHMRKAGLRAPRSVRIHHYSYIWLRPESGSGRGPRHPDRVAEFNEDVARIAQRYGTGA